ncbi:two-component system, OmpR family, phosphate regulon sensor histidine kinase PhoR [Pustulibacterium marinum]|uniref:histidine kinase n=1 Tax=Pustulibacterium marinum TaxID=1224947 RepID=A0A1I7EYY1_9FLAO|nr:HAMP domain-containing sensor histidine kinase [Pustulibacterium marinum]SFU29109.1 two-component system, OmpR family, phosphate regulon sensor histidine kinase PhoR [Pustulibacterium marinum]
MLLFRGVMTSKRSIIIGIFIVSVLGLAFIQYQYLKVGLNLARVQFNQQMLISSKYISEDLATKNDLTFLLGKAITKDDSYFTLSLDSLQDAGSHYLDDFLKERIWGNGLEADFTFQLKTRNNEVLLSSPNHVVYDPDDLILYPVRLEGYLPQVNGAPVTLILEFTDLNSYFLTSLNGLIIPSLLFLLAIIGVVIWVLRSFYWQRKIITTTNDFINNLTHELKTPVFSIGLATKLLEEKFQEETELVTMIRTQNDKLKQHIDAVLELAGMESKKQVLPMQKMNIQEVLLTTAQSFATICTVENVDFQYQIPEEEIFLKGNPLHLSNAVTNLLDNARKYTNESTPKVFLQVAKDQKSLSIEVRDNGIGIPKSLHKQIFKKFYRVSEKDLHSVKGHGLGLSYVYQVVKLHKGKIKVSSEIGKGTSMKISIPLIHG